MRTAVLLTWAVGSHGAGLALAVLSICNSAPFVAEAPKPNAVFDDSGNFLLYSTLLGIKVRPCLGCCLSCCWPSGLLKTSCNVSWPAPC